MNSEERLAEIRSRLESSLAPESLTIEDEGHLHVGHEGARDGRGHFRVRVVSESFRGKNPIRRHRMVYQALAELMQTDIHALAIEALTADEV